MKRERLERFERLERPTRPERPTRISKRIEHFTQIWAAGGGKFVVSVAQSVSVVASVVGVASVSYSAICLDILE